MKNYRVVVKIKGSKEISHSVDFGDYNFAWSYKSEWNGYKGNDEYVAEIEEIEGKRTLKNDINRVLGKEI